MVGKPRESRLLALLPACSSLGTDSLQSVISDPFCVVAPHAGTFDQRAVTKIGPIIESIAASRTPLMAGRYSGNS
jgi:hypothetical protein